MHISKKNWEAVSFGDVAIQQKDDIDRESDAVDRYVAGEHMASEDVHIRQWGVLDGQYLGPAFRRKFEKGDILYGSRRTYLKKVAVADFDGITANTTFVIKPNIDKIFPELLPFLMLSDSFTEHSVKHSKGSVNPYINWKDIANFTFKLPLMAEQKRIAELLWSIDATEERYFDLKKNLGNAFWSYFEMLLSGHKKIKLGELLIPKKTQSVYPHKYEKYLGMEHVDSGAFVSNKYGNSEDAKANTFIFGKGDLLYGKLRPYLDKCVIADFEGVCSTEILVYDIKNGFSKELILFYMHSPSFVNYASSQGYGTKMPRVSHNIISEYVVSMPLEKEQQAILVKLQSLRKSRENLNASLERCRIIKKQIINKIFG